MKARHRDEPVSDINITPLTDVMMVLLVIFMISSPVLLARGMEVHLPQVTEPPMLTEQDHVLYIDADGGLFLDGTTYTENELTAQFTELVKESDVNRDEVNLFIRADKGLSYGTVTHIMDVATLAGIQRISLVQDVLTGSPSGENGAEMPSPVDESALSAQPTE
ncbi:MAG: biopolymer transporter ExbD [bacterium]